MKHLRARSGARAGAHAGAGIGSVSGGRFAALAGATILGALASAPGVARAQAAGSFDNYFMSNGRAFAITPSSSWVGVKVTPNSSSALLRGLSSEGALDTSRKAQRLSSRNIVLVPVKDSASAAQKDALRARLSASSRVASAARAYVFNGQAAAPIVDTGDAIVRFSGGDTRKIAKIVATYGATLVSQVGSFSPNTFVVRVAANGSGVRLANQLAARGDVVFSQPNFSTVLQKRATSNDPLYASQWHLNNTGQSGGLPGADVKAAQAWDVTRGSSNITISVQDDGFDLSHEDLVANLLPGYDFTDGDSDPSPVEGGPEGDNHGTACAGVAGGVGNNGIGVSGAAQNCKILPVRMLGRTTDLDTANAFNYSAARADVISNSWGYNPGFPTPSIITAAIRNAAINGRGGKGCVILFASGNDGISIDGPDSFGVPDISADPNSIAVGATDNFDKWITYSNTGEALDVVAPSGGLVVQQGTLDITTTDRTGADGYTASNYNPSFNGTSSACPLVAGVAALVLSAEPELTAVQVRQRLQDTADKVDFGGGTYDSSGHSRLYGYGRINAYRAVLGRAPKVTLVTPADNAAIRGTVPVSATTTNDGAVKSMAFDQRRVYFSGANAAVNKAIPDYDINGVTDSFAVGAGSPTRFVQATANVRVRIEHSYVGDLQVVLMYKNPSGQDVREIIYDHSNGGDNVLDLDVPLPTALRPVAGTTYTLQVLDDVQQDTGTFVSWSLVLGAPYSAIGTQAAASHTAGTPWSVNWNTSGLPTGTYDVRATATTNGGGNYSDINTGLKLSGVSENSFTISGSVADAKGVAVAGARVTNVTTGQSVLTNASGAFSFSGLASGQYVLSPSISGGFFTTNSQTVTITTASITSLRFVLSQRDTAAPTLTVAAPVSSAFVRTVSRATGTALDAGGSGVVKVTGVLYRAPDSRASITGGYYTAPGTFISTRSDATERVASGTSKWALALPNDEGVYTLTVRAYDKAGNITSKVVTYTVDRTLPTVTIVAPKSAAVLTSSLVVATGTATDNRAVDRVTLLLFRPATTTTRAGYYNPTTKTYTATATAANEILATGTTRWTLRLPVLPSGRYSLRATATDKAGNTRASTVIFTVSAPSSPSA